MGIGTVLGAVGMGIVQNIVFGFMKFDPKELEHQDVVTSFRILVDNVNKDI